MCYKYSHCPLQGGTCYCSDITNLCWSPVWMVSDFIQNLNKRQRFALFKGTTLSFIIFHSVLDYCWYFLCLAPPFFSHLRPYVVNVKWEPNDVKVCNESVIYRHISLTPDVHRHIAQPYFSFNNLRLSSRISASFNPLGRLHFWQLCLL